MRRMPSILRDLHREGANLVRANLSEGSAFPLYWHHILYECRQYRRIGELLCGVVAIPLDITITVPSKAGISVTLETVKEIEHRFFGFGVVFFFGGCLGNGLLHKL